MTLTIGLRGYPEAVLAAETVTLNLPRTETASAVVAELATRSSRLREALVHEDGRPRQSTKVLVNGVPVNHATPLPADATVTVLRDAVGTFAHAVASLCVNQSVAEVAATSCWSAVFRSFIRTVALCFSVAPISTA